MAVTMTMAEGIQRAERTLELWHRVCGDLNDGKTWDDIDISSTTRQMGLEAWRAYMQQKMYLDLNALVTIYRNGLGPA